MDKKSLTRRSFSKMVAGSFLAGNVLEAAVQERRSVGSLSDQAALTLLEHIGYRPTLPNEMETLKPMLDLVIRDLQTIRDFDVAITLEPAFIFRADR